MAKVYHKGRLLWDKIEVAATPIKRFKGLMGRRKLSEGEGMLIKPCNQVHTFHMRFSLDILYITKEMRVAAIQTLSPGKVGARVKQAALVLEVSANSAKQFNIMPGDPLTFELEKNKGGYSE